MNPRSESPSRLKVDLTKYIEEHNFVFDASFGEEKTNWDVYEESVRPLVSAAFQKAKTTCFAYGRFSFSLVYFEF